MSDLASDRLVERLLPTVLAAGALELRYYEAGVATELKSDETPVTAADREAEAVLLEALARVAPGIPVVAEEAWSAGAATTPGDTFFLVDPLDGTREFIEKRREFTVNIALIEAGRPRFGIIYAPALGMLAATFGPGDARETLVHPGDTASSVTGLAWRAMRTRRAPLAAQVAVASRSHLNAETAEMLDRYRVASTRNAGSSLKFCLVARGEADIYPRLAPTREWDIAAGHAILSAAGGSVTMVDGSPLAYGKVSA
ncbi:MAG TPA: 3'(2'),5'-bisphosphate nucleotidase CysQ, partial [Hyphomicrobiaceae bacterium]|nr:3'(2'),5'-bisphosphate nucleotidase CysQ [Hyphomicrobiaceae bacterium]